MKTSKISTTSKNNSIKQAFLYFAIYTVMFLIVAAGVFFVFFREHRSFVWGDDGVSQYLPKAYYYIIHAKDFIRNLLHGNFAFEMYDFSYAYGDTVPLHTEPLYFLYLLFHAKDAELAFSFIFFLRYYLAGLTAYISMIYFKQDKIVSIFSSFIYIFAGYGLWGAGKHAHFLCGMILLPLLIIAIEEIYQGRRWYLCTIFMAISYWCGYYFAYMNTFAMGIYFLVRYFTGERKKSVTDFLKVGFTIAGSYLLGAAIANITFFNSFANYLRSDRSIQMTTEKVPIDLVSWGPGYLVKFYQFFINNTGEAGPWMVLGFIPLCYFLVILLLIRKGNKARKILLAAGFILSMFPVFGYVMTGFSTANSRWSYILALLIAMISAGQLPQLLSVNRKELLIMGILVIPYVLIGCLGLFEFKVTASSTMTSIFLFVTYLGVWCIYLINKKSRRFANAMLYVIVIASLWGSAYMRNDNKYGKFASTFPESGKALSVATDTPTKVYKKIKDDSFFRVDTNKDIHTQNSASLILGDHGLNVQNSTVNNNVVRFMMENGNTDWIVTRLLGLDSRAYLYALNDVKYYIVDRQDPGDIPYGFTYLKTAKQDGVKYDIYENELALPFGYTYDSVMTLEEAARYSDWEKQEVMLQTAILSEDDAYLAAKLPKKSYAEIESRSTEIPIKEIAFSSEGSYLTGQGMHMKAKDTVTITFDGLPECETYVIWEDGVWDSKSHMDVKITSGNRKKTFDFRGKLDTYYTKQKDYIFNLGYSEEGKTICEMKFPKECDLQFGDLKVVCVPMKPLDSYLADRSRDVLEQVEFTANQVKGNISLDQEKLLVFSFPRLNGWTCTIDGVKTELLKANYMFTSVMVPAGEHEIILKFEMPGIRISLLLTAISVGIFLIILLLTKKKHNKI